MRIPVGLIRTITKVGSTIKKYSPQIMMVVGSITSVAAVVEAVKQTPKAMDILDEHKETVKTIREDFAESEELNKKLAIQYFNTGKKLGKTYAMPIVMETTSLLCFFNAHRIMSIRNKQLTIALATITDAYNNYRNKMIEALGEEKEEQIRLGLEQEKRQVELVDESGKKKKKTQLINVFDMDTSELGPWDFLWCEDDYAYDQSEGLNDLTIANVEDGFTLKLYEENSIDELPAVRIISKFIGEKKANKISWALYNGYTQLNRDRKVIISSRNVEVRYRNEDGDVRYKNGRILTLNGDGNITRNM